MSRRRRKRRRFPREPVTVPEPEPSGPVDHALVAARFRHLVGRNITFGFEPHWPVVEAKTPEELTEKVEEALLAEAEKQQPS